MNYQEHPDNRSNSSYMIILLIILVIAAWLRLYNINQPFVDIFSWRQTSTAMMADNYYLENWNVFFPATNWHGPEPSYQGREFQTVSYTAALLYILFGQQDWIGRSIAVAFGIWGIFALYQLTEKVWDRDKALVAAGLMAVLPGSVFIERSFLPDPAMVALVTTSVWLLVSYLQTGRKPYLFLASLIGAWGILTKIPGAIVGLPSLYAIIAILKAKRQLTLAKLAVLGGVGLVTLIPVVIYYLWARHLSVTYPPFHFAGSSFWVWDNGLQEWLNSYYFLPDLQWVAYNWLWTVPVVYSAIAGLFIQPHYHPSHVPEPKPKAPWLFHWWFLAGIIYYMIGAHELVVNVWNLHIVSPAIAALSANAIVWFANQFRKLTILTGNNWFVSNSLFWGFAGMLVLTVALFGQTNLEDMYNRSYGDESFQLGVALQQASQPGDLVVTMSSDLGDPNAIYYSQRRGWTFPPVDNEIDYSRLPDDDDFSIELFEQLRAEGADWFGVAAANFQMLWVEHPELTAHIEETTQLHSITDDYVIYKILDQAETATASSPQSPQPITSINPESFDMIKVQLSIPQAKTATLVWGVNGEWVPVSSELQPPGTKTIDNIMFTPMQTSGDEFSVTLTVPRHSTVYFGFLIKPATGNPESYWITEGETDFSVTTDAVDTIKVFATFTEVEVDKPSQFSFEYLLLPLFGLTVGIIALLYHKHLLHFEQISSHKFPLPYLRDLLRELVSRDMKLRYKRSVLGVAWSLLNPLAQLLVLNFVFSWVLPLDIDNYPVFLFIGLLVWTWFQTSLFNATSVIIDNPDLIRRPGFPVAILPIVTVSTNLIHFLLAMPVLLLFLPSGGVQLSAALLALPLLVGLQFLLTLSLSYLLAAIHVTFRDTQYLLGIALLLGFYLSPIFYKTSLIPQQLQWLYRLNPMVDLIDSYRVILMQGSLPSLLPLLAIGVGSMVMLWLGYTIFVHQSYRFVEEI